MFSRLQESTSGNILFTRVMSVKRRPDLGRIEHAHHVAVVGPLAMNDGTSVKWWMRGQPLALPAGEVMRQRIGYESTDLIDFGLSTLSNIDTTTSDMTAAI
jgi:hypothetical protein